MKNKAQGTTEYLIILAVIIIIALVVAGVMGWFPGLGGAITEQQSKAYWQGTSPLAVTDWKIGSTGARFTLKNVSTDKIELTDIGVSGTALGLADVNINAGETYTTDLDNSVTCTSGTYQHNLEISYNVVGGISGKKLVGAKPIVGTCG
ncbi:MAG: hypothetical protein N3F05_02285 [Candidatus Diapherotrites archaeon]|nr:hypothetical protein [Candidatus Diapherotrites archaeon]